jgi:hypothetical protein
MTPGLATLTDEVLFGDVWRPIHARQVVQRDTHASAVGRGPNQQRHQHNHHRQVRSPDLESPRSVQLMAHRTSRLFREGPRDVHRNRLHRSDVRA